MPSARVQAYEDKPCKVPPGRTISDTLTHLLPSAPRCPDQASRLRTREPIVMRLTFGRKSHANELRAQPFGTMVVDGGSQILQLTTGSCFGDHARRVTSDIRFGGAPRLRNPVSNVLPARCAIDVGERLIGPPFSKDHDPSFRYRRIRMFRRLVAEVDVQNVQH